MEERDIGNGTESAAQVREAVQQALAGGKTQTAIAREIGVGGPTLSQWLKGAYRGNAEAVETKVAIWMASRRAKEAAALPAAPRLADTPTGRAIRSRLYFAQAEGCMVVIHGGAGVGKTTAALRYKAESPNVWIYTARPSSSSLGSALDELAAALDLRGLPNQPGKVSAEIVARVRGTGGLLVVDEAQHLSVAALEELRSIHDASGIGLALVGNETVYSRLTGGSRRQTFAQLFSRIAKRQHIPWPTPGDVDAVLKSYQVKDKEVREFAQQAATLPGGLRSLCNALRQAAIEAKATGEDIDLSTVHSAWRELGGES